MRPVFNDSMAQSLNHILVLDKPAGMSSARAVDQVKRLLPRGTKIGHAGTLDPFATRVLLMLIGKATKLCEKLMDQPKQYETTVKLGATTATDDLESPEEEFRATGAEGGLGVSPERNVLGRDAQATNSRPTTEQIRSALPRFVGA